MLDRDIEQLLERTRSVTFNATDELKVDLLQSSLNLTPTNWLTGSHDDSCHVQVMGDDSGFLNDTPISTQVNTCVGVDVCGCEMKL